MKILFVNNLYTPNIVGGAERVIQSLAEGLVEAGHQAVVVSVAPEKSKKVSWVNGVKVYYVGLKNLYWLATEQGHPMLLKALWHALDTYNPWMAREVAPILDEEHPDIVNTSSLSGFSMSVYQPAKRRDLPLVHTLQDYYSLCPRNFAFRKGKNCEEQCADCRLYALPRKHFSNQVDIVVGASLFTLSRHLELGYFTSAPKRKVIYNAHPIEEKPVESSLDMRSRLVRFGYLGRLAPNKGLEVLLESIIQLPRESWNLKLGGQGLVTYERYLRSRYKAPGIEFLGFVRPDTFFSKIDVLVVPSLWHDPSPRVINEAYARGVPVIGSSRGGIPELIEEGYTGFMFDSGRPDGLITALKRYIDDPALINYMQTACLEKARSFLPERIIEQYLDVYAEAVEGV